MGTLSDKSTPIEVWLSKRNIAITCRVAHEDESTEYLRVDSLSMRGAQREVTGWLLGRGYEPVGRWITEEVDRDEDGDEVGARETMRLFKVTAADDQDDEVITTVVL